MNKQLSEPVVRNMTNWLDLLQIAISKKDKYEIIRLYDLNETNSSYKWDIAPEDLQNRYDTLTDKANAVLDN